MIEANFYFLTIDIDGGGGPFSFNACKSFKMTPDLGG